MKHAHEWRRTEGGEPHRIRRRAILAAHPEIRALFGWDPAPKYQMAAVIIVQLALAVGVEHAMQALDWRLGALVLLAVAYLFGAVLNHFGGCVIHEASHDLCARTKTQNRLVAIVANLPKVLPYAMTFRRHHMTHHAGLGVLGRDNDLPTAFEQRLVGNVAWRKLVWLVLYPFAGALLRSFFHRPNRWEVFGIALQIAFDVAVAVFLGPWALLYLAVSTFFSASLHPIAGHFIHEHYLWDEGQETYSYYGPLNTLTMNMGFHVEHHDFVEVPGKHLPRLHAIAREHYEGLVSHRSWTEILATFVREPRLSHHSRFVRTRSSLRAADNRTVRTPGARV
jgi:sphingolipid delta-4 desaturase